MRHIVFTPAAFTEYNEWYNNKEVIDKIKVLIRDIDRDPFRGFGKPEPLRGSWSGYWSRRVNHEHRLIYKYLQQASSLSSAGVIID